MRTYIVLDLMAGGNVRGGNVLDPFPQHIDNILLVSINYFKYRSINIFDSYCISHGTAYNKDSL